MSLKKAVRSLIILECPEALEAVDIRKSKTTKTALSCEKELERYLVNLYSLIIKNKMSELSARYQFEEEVRRMTRSCVQKTWFAGMDYVGKATKTSPTLKVDDVLKMEEVVERIVNDFFAKISNLIPVMEAVKKEDWSDWINVFSFAKTNQLIHQQIVNQVKTIPASNMFRVLDMATTDTMQALNADGTISTKGLVFTTEDDINVCATCYPYHDRVYDNDDPYKPEIPVHPNCRCRYLIEDDQGNGIYG